MSRFNATMGVTCRRFGSSVNMLNQAWTNILDNAVDASDGKGSVVKIENNGSGAEAELACIFEPFYTTKPQGLERDSGWTLPGGS